MVRRIYGSAGDAGDVCAFMGNCCCFLDSLVICTGDDSYCVRGTCHWPSVLPRKI